uniref:CENP-V/GFA domain-containing protein n=1 Tax=Craspedostauros australis TaxID=1486917 RepID=A0A7R9ZLI3_9STRA|mmetsp:Transcript_20514/g.57075  ORF Transcript_20514/g.57075 Transcript_20514/m.57075 type:complete len:130 (+) Transcript_20514:160-549(+)
MATREWSCMCGNFKGEVTGEPNLAVWCHCEQCRQQTGAPMELGIFEKLEAKSGDDDLISYEHTEGSGVQRKSCKKCGSFCYKLIGDTKVAPLGSLSGEAIKPTCNIFVADKGSHAVMAPDLPQHDGFPA